MEECQPDTCRVQTAALVSAAPERQELQSMPLLNRALLATAARIKTGWCSPVISRAGAISQLCVV